MISKPSKIKTLFLLMVCVFIATAAFGLIIPILPDFMGKFNTNGQMMGLLVATYGIIQLFLSPIAGRFADRYGRKRIIEIGLICLTLSQLVFAFSVHFWLLFLGRFLTGIAVSLLIPGAMACIIDITTEEERAKGLSFLNASISFGFVIGPGIGGFLTTYGLYVPFYFATVLSFVSFLLSFFLLPETLEKKTEMTKADTVSPQPMVQQILRSIRVPYVVPLLLVFLYSVSLYIFEAIFGLFVAKQFGYTAKDIAMVITIAAFVSVMVQLLLTNKLVSLFGESKVMNGTMIAGGVSFLFLLFTTRIWSILLLTCLLYTATSILRPVINTVLSKLANNEQGFIAGMNNAYVSLGSVVGPILGGILFDINTYFPYVIGVLAFLTGTVLLTWKHRSLIST
ncbi:MFS transporter [Enterococcus avium]|uniref:Putative multidrug efflux protein n=1 Tax=Enterococcus faecium TaxID=1352 RepID=Q6V4U1_ENTFC|nr:putative multidrug efflux protein [Enterococcus faecium]EMF0442267.1 tetracycline resistance MFS efflux pump [Enterococcus hirae]